MAKKKQRKLLPEEGGFGDHKVSVSNAADDSVFISVGAPNDPYEGYLMALTVDEARSMCAYILEKVNDIAAKKRK